MRISLALVGVVMLLWAVWGKEYRFGLYDFKDDSDKVLDRRKGRKVAAIIGIAYIVGAIFYKGQQ